MKVNFTADEKRAEKMRRLVKRRRASVTGDWFARAELARMRAERRRELMR